jgi:divalent metal cation (Fe/Co/Zn/Cd) transporter
MLLDAALPQEYIQKIKEILDAEPIITAHHYLKTRESASEVFISVHAVFNVSISLYDAHLVADKIEARIKALFKDKKAHILIHMDPYDDSQINEMEDAL